MQINQPDDNCSQPILLTIFNRNAYQVYTAIIALATQTYSAEPSQLHHVLPYVTD